MVQCMVYCFKASVLLFAYMCLLYHDCGPPNFFLVCPGILIHNGLCESSMVAIHTIPPSLPLNLSPLMVSASVNVM